jgi:hypothetical protein
MSKIRYHIWWERKIKVKLTNHYKKSSKVVPSLIRQAGLESPDRFRVLKSSFMEYYFKNPRPTDGSFKE